MDERRQRGKQFFIDLARAAAGSGDSNPYEVKDLKSNNNNQVAKSYQETVNPITTDNNLEQTQKQYNSIKNQEIIAENTKQEDPSVDHTNKEYMKDFKNPFG